MQALISMCFMKSNIYISEVIRISKKFSFISRRFKSLFPVWKNNSKWNAKPEKPIRFYNGVSPENRLWYVSVTDMPEKWIQDVSTSISIRYKFEEMSEGDDESDKHLEARDRRNSCLISIQGVPFSIYLFQMALPLNPFISQPML